jgi:hypothetical protein
MARKQLESRSFVGTPLADFVPADTLEVLEAALARDPAARPGADGLAAALSARRAVGLAPGEPIPAPVGTGRGRFRPARVAVAVLAAFGLIGVGVLGRVALWGGGAEAAPTTVPYCEVYAKAVRDRSLLFERISSDLEVATSPTEVIRRLVSTYPSDFADAIRPWLVRTSTLPGENVEMSLSTTELEELALADALRSLTGGKPFIYDGEDGSFDPDQLPGELRDPARIASEAATIATKRCPAVHVNLRAAKARMSSSILSNLSDPEFMNKFFYDPASLDLFGPRTVSLMLSIARPFFDGLLQDHWDFFIRLCDHSPEVRSLVAFEEPDIFLGALAARPDLTAVVRQPSWMADLTRGYARLSPAARVGVQTLYHPQLVALGLEPS